MSLANFCRWLGEQAEQLGVEIFPGFTASDIIVEDGIVKGIVTGEMGVSQNGEKSQVINQRWSYVVSTLFLLKVQRTFRKRINR